MSAVDERTVRLSPAEETFGIHCRACGAPRSLEAAPCPSCGAEPPDESDLVRLRTHQDRLRRSFQRLRAVATKRLLYTQQSGLIRRTRRAGQIVIAVAFFSLFAAPMAYLEGDLSCGGVLLLVLGWCVFAYLGYRAYTLISSHTSAQARRAAAQQLSALELTVDARCPSCGGHAALLSLETEVLTECPWCSTGLAPGSEARDAQLEALQALLWEETQGADLAVNETKDPEHETTGTGPPSGFRETAEMLHGEHDGVAMWSGTEAFGGREVTRLEADAETGFGARMFFTTAEHEENARRMAAEWKVALPTRQIATWGDGWLLYASSDEPLRHREWLPVHLFDLEESDSLIVDLAGLSVWRYGFSVPGLDGKQRDLLASLARDLRQLGGTA